MRAVTRALAKPHQETTLEPVVVAEGTIDDFEFLTLDSYFLEGETGELQLYLDPALPDSEMLRTQEGVDELEQELRADGALPWPGADRIVYLDWPNRLVFCQFQQGIAFFAALGGVLWRLVLFAVPLGLKFLPKLANYLKGLPLTFLIPAGLLVFLALAPSGTAFRVFRWVGKVIGGVVGELVTGIAGGLVGIAQGLGPWAFVAAGGLVLVGASKLKEGGRGSGR